MRVRLRRNGSDTSGVAVGVGEGTPLTTLQQLAAHAVEHLLSKEEAVDPAGVLLYLPGGDRLTGFAEIERDDAIYAAFRGEAYDGPSLEPPGR